MSEADIDGRLPIEVLRGQAIAASRLRASAKVRAVLACVRNGIALGVSESEIFGLSCGEESGVKYWQAFLNQPMTEAEMIRAIATHLASPARIRVGQGGAVAMANLPLPQVQAAFNRLPDDLRPGSAKVFPDNVLRALLRISPDELPPSLLAYLDPSNLIIGSNNTSAEPITRWSQARMEDDINSWCAKTGIGDRERAWREEYKARQLETGWTNISFREAWTKARGRGPGRPPKSA
ncbi:hypothetical protein PX554_03375 [Sphingomonas sp. H39-1-10]|uniref:hypothetical protein n=1 Tax=Sphingomonas pollutisoli TaxID=3030829 RepID=UPI0023B99C22|nr:hypothetical protein [Sphingomonas pollutisoli]MDF0487160.1 hypothetical protein [Sphingomonas pollutisoli]